MLKHGILGLLGYGDKTGYQVMEVFRDSLGFFWNAHTSQIYRELNGLEAKGWATSRIVPQADKPDRRVYSITDAGRAELQTWLARPFPTQAREPLLMQVFFMAALPPEVSAQRFGELQAFAQGFLDDLDTADTAVEHYTPRTPGANDALFWEMTVDFGRRYTRMIADWSADCQERLGRICTAAQPTRIRPHEPLDPCDHELMTGTREEQR